MTYAVIDTNVFVASFLTRHDDAATVRIVRAMGSGVFTLLYNDEIIEEYREVLSRAKFGIAPAIVGAVVDRIRRTGKSVERIPFENEFADEDDRVFYEVALSRKEQGSKLVTGNARHYPREPLVVSPREFCELIGV